jgi:hypothetical protein
MVTYHDGLVPRPSFRPDLSRTISAWGENAQRSIARLRIGIAGAGSVGFLVAEALARMGCTFLRLFDFDRVEEVNLDRLIYATKDDARLRRPKVEVLAEALRRSATADRFQVEPLQWSVVEVEGYRSALDGDVLFSCVDRPWPRSVLNLIASAHLIPVVDGGIAVTVKVTTATMRGADWRAHIAAPGRRCLECLGEYNPGDVSAEREGYFDDPAYIRSLDDGHFIKRKQNVFAFSMSAASFEILQFLSMIVAPFGVSKTGAQLYHFVTGRLDHDFSGCNEGCLFPGVTAKGDLSGLVMTGRHRAAEDARHQTTAAASGRSWFRRWLWPW